MERTMDTAQATLPIAALKPSPTNLRKSFDEGRLAELTESIRAKGVLTPVLVRPLAPGAGMEIVAGERRWRAARAAGLVEIPAVVRNMSDAEVLEAQLVENLQREDLHPLEEAEGYRRLSAGGLDAQRISERTSRSVGHVYDRMKLLSLTKEAQKAFREGLFSTGHAVLLARLIPADQKRAMEETHALFTYESGLLFRPEDIDDARRRREDDPKKPRSVREFQAWIDEHVRLDPAKADPMLFPDLVATVRAAADKGEKVVRITYDAITPPEARGGPKLVLGRSWKRADGKFKSKTCDRSAIGTIEIGPGRSEVLRVCVDKQHCQLHWGELIRARKRREKDVAKEASTGEDREKLRRTKEKRDEARRKAEAERWALARPAILEALAGVVKRAPAGAGSPCGRRILEAMQDAIWVDPQDRKLVGLVPPGETAEELVRHLAFGDLVASFSQVDYADGKNLFVEGAKALGVDVLKILAAAAPPPEKAAPAKKAKKAKRGKAA